MSQRTAALLEAGRGTVTEKVGRWIWAYLASAALWIAVGVIVGRGMGGTLTAVATVAAFYFIAGSGQMFVIGLGNGHIDLSIPYVMTVSGIVAVDVMRGSNAGLVGGLLLGLGVGLAVGLVNVVVVRLLRVEPIIGTLAVGFVLQTVALRLTAAISPPKPSPALASFTVLRVGGVPVLPLVFIGVAVVLSVVAGRSLFGRAVAGYGQSAPAAVLAQLGVGRAVTGCYALSGVLAGLAGVLLAAYSGGASLDASVPFLLGSIAVVVLGGSPISGGEMSVAGVWGGALLLTFITTAVSAVGLSGAWQDLVEGIIIIVALSLRRGAAEA